MAHWCLKITTPQFLAPKQIQKIRTWWYIGWFADTGFSDKPACFYLLCACVRQRVLLICVYQLHGRCSWSTGHSKMKPRVRVAMSLKLWPSKWCAGQHWFPSSTRVKCVPKLGMKCVRDHVTFVYLLLWSMCYQYFIHRCECTDCRPVSTI